MDQIKRYEEEVKIEEYFEEKRLYELFQSLFKELLVHRPDDPLEFLMEKLKNPVPIKRFFVVGPPGSNRKETALSLADHFGGWPCISVGDLLNKEVAKKSEWGKEIAECKKMYKYIKDDIVIELVKNAIQEYEKDNKNWIIEGFPRTMGQVVAMQKGFLTYDTKFPSSGFSPKGIYPTRVILLNVKKPSSQLKVKNNLISNATGLYGPELERVANNAIDEYYHHIKSVKELYKEAELIIEYDANTNKTAEIAKMIQIRLENPFRLPRIILLGPPGSGKTMQGEMIAYNFGLTFINMKELLDREIGNKSEHSQEILDCLMIGNDIPDDIIMPIVEK